MINSLRVRVILLMTVGLTATAGFAYLTVNAFLNFERASNETHLSFAVQDRAENMLDPASRTQALKELSERQSTNDPPHRKEGLPEIIKSAEGKRITNLKAQVHALIKNEKAYRQYISPLQQYSKKRMLYFGTFTLFSALISLGLVLWFLLRGIFRPLRDLSEKMVDFQNDKYTYQFSVPPPNEVGDLQKTFNALAQRVLTNMDELKSLDKAKSEFLSIASHELRTPLTSIKGSLSLLKSGVVGSFPDPALNLLNIAETETDRLVRLINELLDLAKIEAGKFPLNKGWGRLRPIVDKTIEALNGFSQKANVTIVAPDIPSVKIHADGDRIQQVLTNLLSNAIKYSPEGGQITLTVEAEEGHPLRISVTDQGKGIAPEDQELIFEQFRQATGPSNPLVKGTGLGLAIAKALVDEHCGTIGVYSVVNEGATFYFDLPDWEWAQEAAVEKTTDESVAA